MTDAIPAVSPGCVDESRKFNELCRSILEQANKGFPRARFVRDVTRYLLRYYGCDAVQIRVRENGRENRWRGWKDRTGQEFFEASPACIQGQHNSDRVTRDFMDGRLQAPEAQLCPHGTLFTTDAGKLTALLAGSCPERAGGGAQSLIRIPFLVDHEDRGLLEIQWEHRDAFSPEQVELFESVARFLGIALVNHRTHAALVERVRELTCLSAIARVVGQAHLGQDEVLRETVLLLPTGWQYPEVAEARITLDSHSVTTDGFTEDSVSLSAPLLVGGTERGQVQVAYRETRPPADEGPFLKEERTILNTVAHELGALVEMKESDMERAELQEQLRHADRLATIGQLSAGVAHEINEPLGSILGFAQLCAKHEALPGQAARDLERIVAATMHAREIIRKLMLFARQRPPTREPVSLNKIVGEGLDFLALRAAGQGIALVRTLSPDLPEIQADPNQLHQVLVNLVVNAIQAMPQGGTLNIETLCCKDGVILAVEDQGEGIDTEALKQIFVPFFTTKEVGEGTGLGLSVVHGIVASHDGTIHVESTVGQGSRFEVRLPVAQEEALMSGR